MSATDTQFELSSSDTLSTFVGILHIERLLLAHVKLGEPVRVVCGNLHPVLHFVRQGNATFVGHNTRIGLSPGDVVLLPHGGPYVLGSGPEVASISFDIEMPQEDQCSIRVGGDGPESEFYCCAFGVSESSASLLKLLPPVLVYRGSRRGTIAGTLDVLFAERARQLPTEPGAIALQLAQILLITILRGNLEEGNSVGVGLLSALAEPRLCRAITSLQSNLGNDWSVASLATEAGMSRASFSSASMKNLALLLCVFYTNAVWH